MMHRSVTRFTAAAANTTSMVPVRTNAIAAINRYLMTTEDNFNLRYGQQLVRAVDFKPDTISDQLVVVPGDIERLTLIFPFLVTADACNGVGSCHGGVLSSLADVFTTVHLWGLEPERKHVSVNLDVNFLAAAFKDSTVECHTTVSRMGKRLSFTDFRFIDVNSQKLLATGTHNKAYI